MERGGDCEDFAIMKYTALGLKTLLFFALLLQVENTNAQLLQFNLFDVENGLPENSVNTLLQDDAGFIWVGTQAGLLRYDGVTFKSWKPEGNVEHPVAGQNVRDLAKDKDDNIWIATVRAGLIKYDPGTEIFTSFRHNPDDSTSIPTDDIRRLLIDKNGKIWIATDGEGLCHFTDNNQSFACFTTNPDFANSIPDDYVNTIFQDESGEMWVATYDGLSLFDPIIGAFHQMAFEDDFSVVITCIYQTSPSFLWIGSEEGLFRMDLVERIIRPVQFDDDIDIGEIHALMADNSGQLWIGTTGDGVVLYDIERESAKNYRHDNNNPKSLADDFVQTLLFDKSGVMWVGTADGGLNRQDLTSNRFPLYRHSSTNELSLGDDRVLSIYEAPSEPEVVWVGTYDGLNRFDKKTGGFRLYQQRNRDLTSLPDNRIQSIMEDRDGRLWIGSYGGLSVMNRQTGKFSTYQFDPDDDNSISDDWVQDIFQDQAGNIWVATLGAGINRFDQETGKFTRYEHDPADNTTLSANAITFIYESPRSPGKLWLGTDEGGLNILDIETDQVTRVFENENISFASAYKDRAGRMWLGTYANGLILLDKSDLVIKKQFSVEEGLPHTGVYRILEDRHGNLWLSTGNGLSRFSPEKNHFRNYNLSDGLQGKNFTLAAFRSTSGTMYFGGRNGFNAFDPDDLADNENRPSVVITNFKLEDEPVLPNAENGVLETSISEAIEINVPHDSRLLTFEFAALHFVAPDQNEFAFKLEPYNKNWVYIGKEHHATFVNLRPDEYTFRVKAMNSDGLWNEVGTSVALIVHPPAYKTWWAYTIYAILAIIVAITGNRMFRRQVIRRERELAHIREAELLAETAEARAELLKAENDRKTEELEEARQLQLSMLPKHVPDHPHVSLAAYMQTATEVGGDYYDFAVDDKGDLTMAIGDATGHGMRAGTMVTATKSLFNILSHEPDLTDVLRRSTYALKQMQMDKMYMALAMIKVKSGSLDLAGAGMPPAIIYRAKNDSVDTIALKGMPLGGMQNYPYSQTRIDVAAGDTLLFMSDGFPELFNPAGEMLGYDKMVNIFSEVRTKSPQDIIEHFCETAKKWSAGRPLDDDVTFVAMKIK